ncbi:MAG: tRNA (adenosine(37)-N6)-dimethylallyltransferase MiaA [Holosporales bacterium]|nr:tRNA (adenosine(37)-N6)-dimethylallyltransferase MiaA [Holosporales bacterium]
MNARTKKVLIIIGPTASGKTARAIEIATERNGVIINCDSLQTYDCLKILTAFPSEAYMKRAPHELFGYLKYYDESSAVAWATLASQRVIDTLRRNVLPIVVGGTGFYINILVNGISPLPAISDEVRKYVARMDYDELRARLYEVDPQAKAAITKQQHHQTVRAYEILLETGKSILSFKSLPKKTFLQDIEYEYDVTECDRKRLYDRINARFERMLDAGAVDEVEQFLYTIGYSRSEREAFWRRYHIFSAIGAKEITMYLDGDISFSLMKEVATRNLRHYAKRQITWIRHQMPQTL